MKTEYRLLMVCGALASGEACGFAAARFGACWPLAVLAAAAVVGYGYALAWRFWREAAVFFAGLALALCVCDARSRAVREASEANGGLPYEARFGVEGAATLREGNDGTWVSFPSRLGPLAVRVVCPLPLDGTLPREGEVWSCAGWLAREPDGAGRRPRRFWVRGAGTFARRAAAAPRGTPGAALRRWRRALVRRTGLGLEHDAAVAALNRAMLAGNRDGIDRATRRAFVESGTMHVLAVSGLHVVAVARVLSVLLVLAGLPLRVTGLVLVPVLWLYVALISFPASAVRAAGMASLCSAAPVFWRRPDALAAWALTFLAVHVLDAGALRDTASQLSFAVTLGLVLWQRWCAPALTARFAAAGFALSAWAAGVPIVARVFSQVTFGGLAANLFVVPAAGGSVMLGVLGFLSSFVSETAAVHLNNMAGLLTRAMIVVSRFVASVPGSSVAVVPWSGFLCAAWYAAVLLFFWLVRERCARRRARLVVPPFAASAPMW